MLSRDWIYELGVHLGGLVISDVLHISLKIQVTSVHDFATSCGILCEKVW